MSEPAASLHLPAFPWDTLAEVRRRAQAHPGGLVDLSVGTPVDPTPQVIRQALAAASDAHGYPQTHGTEALREAVASWFTRRRGVPDVDPDSVLPTVGSKELVAWLPFQLGLGSSDVVGHPAAAYPTYDVGARLAGAQAQVVEGLTALGPSAGSLKLLWLNSPGNPNGRVLGVDHLRKVVDWARARGVVVASDECYAELDWRDEAEQNQDATGVPSILDPRVCGGDHTGLLAVYSLSKQSNLAGYRAAFVAGDRALTHRLLEVRKHSGMIVPAPVQAAMVAALGDEDHVRHQREIYRRRRHRLVAAVEAFGMRIDHSEAGLYLWATGSEPAAETLRHLAEHGILVAPGTFYGAAGARHVRIALTASDERIDAAAGRLHAAARA